jgi:acetyl esterase/lipase
VGFLAAGLFTGVGVLLGAQPGPAKAPPGPPRSFAAARATAPDRVIVFKRVGDLELRLHAFLPPAPAPSTSTSTSNLNSATARERGRVPAIVYFFGGGWRGGEPAQFFWQARYLADRGVAGFCAEYRVMKAGSPLTPVDCAADAKSALRYVRAHAAELGLDPRRIAACGNSSGAQLAAAAGLCLTGDDPADPSPEVSSRADALLLFDTPVDLFVRDDIVARFPSPEAARALSPLQNLRADAPPMLLWHGAADPGLPAADAERFTARARELGVDATIQIWPGGVHGFYHYARDLAPDVYDAFLATTLSVDRWLVARGWLTGAPDEAALRARIGPRPPVPSASPRTP